MNLSKITSSCRAAALFAAAALTTVALSAADSGFNSTDKSFLENAYQDGLAEVAMGQLALAKTASPDIKAFAQHMVDDHGKANTDLKTLADSKKVAVASEPSLTAKAKSKMADAKSGADFDKTYAESMVNDHKKAIELFEKAAQDAGDPEVKAFATKTLPTLKMHLSMAEELQGKVGK
jgi:putative membrane protein